MTASGKKLYTYSYSLKQGIGTHCSLTYMCLHSGHDEADPITGDLELIGLLPGQDSQNPTTGLEGLDIRYVVLARQGKATRVRIPSSY